MEKNNTLTLLRQRSFPDLAHAVRAVADVVVSRWIDEVRQALPAADELTLSQLRDDLPYIIENIAVALETQGGDVAEDLKAVSSAHGAVRFHQSYNVGELLLEYSILRPVLLEEVSARLARPATAQESIALNQGLDISLRRSVMIFVNHLVGQMQSSSEAQSKYLSFLSHDLRGGLNGVVLMMEVLKRDLSGEPKFSASLEDLDVMRRAILDTVGTMDRFLHAERFRKGKVQVKPAMLDIAALVSDLCGQFAYPALDKGVMLKQEVSGDLRVMSDRDLLMLILQNVIANAIKYGRKRDVTIAAARGDAGVRISVHDNGPGISPDKLKGLFTPFTRGETHGQGGVGLGLSIARQAADLLGAKLWAESVVGDGSTFHLELPASS